MEGFSPGARGPEKYFKISLAKVAGVRFIGHKAC
jgi:hypothetical protein